MKADQYELLHVSWKEMRELLTAQPVLRGYPKYYAVDPNGALRIWPKFDSSQMVLLFKFKGKK